MATSDTPAGARVEQCDLCIVGAGLAGINALFVASRYLSPEQRVILVDRRQRVGGMWVDTYSYVRLHQPHPMFTAGNIEWTLGQDRSYLATKGEVLDHFQHCLNVIKQRMRVDEFFGWEFESDDESDSRVRIACRSSDGERLVIDATRLIKAYGFGVQPNDALDISSNRVLSVSPDFCDMRGDEMRASDTPVWIIGGGKTAMDTAHALITEYPAREVNLVAGSGTFFTSRDKVLPTGVRRYWRGKPFSSMGLELTGKFDGTNEAEVGNWYRETYGTWLTPTTANFLLGVLSESENTTIASGLNDVIMDYAVDVVDHNGDTNLVFRSGATKAVQAGSWIVNCTGYVMRRDIPYEPYISPGGSVVSIQPRSATMHLTSYMGYFLTHMLLLDKISEIPLYALDGQELRAKSREVGAYATLSLVQYNMSLMSDNLPGKVFSECGLDFDRWYPLPRRMIALARYMRMHRRDRAHWRRTLDTLRERFDVRCGPVVGTR